MSLPALSGTRASKQQPRALIDLPFTDVVNAIDDVALILLYPDGIVASWNDGARRTTGYTAGEMTGRHFAPLIRAGERNKEEAAALLNLAAVEGRHEYQDWHHRKDGSRFWAHVHLIPVPTQDGTLVGYRLSIRDLTSTRATQTALKESEERFRAMADSAPVLLWMAGPDALCSFFNEGWLRFTGRSMALEMGSGWAESVHPEDLQHCMQEYLGAFVTRRPFTIEYRLRRADGQYRWVLDQATPRFALDGEFVGYIGSCVDITEQTQAHEALSRLNATLEERVAQRTAELERVNASLLAQMAERRAADQRIKETEARLHAFISYSPAMICIKDLQGRYLFVNERYTRCFGLERSDIVQRTAAQVFPPEQAAQFDESDRRALESGSAIEAEETVRFVDGMHTNLVYKFPLFDAAGKIIAIAGSATDITERKRAERELENSRTLLNEAQKLAHLGSWRWDLADAQVVWSEELYRLFGVDAPSGKCLYEVMLSLIPSEERPSVDRTIRAALVSGESFTMEHRVVRPDHAERIVRSIGEFVKDARGEPLTLMVSVLDITEQKHAQDALLTYAQQLQALSQRLVEVQESERKQLARELHDRVGQNLTALSINLDILRTRLSAKQRPEVRTRLTDSIALVESTAEAIENVMSELRPSMLDDHGLLAALQWYARMFTQRTGIDVDVKGKEPRPRPAQESEITLFRIAQEALNNVAKHAHAAQVEIKLDCSTTQCVMRIADDGVGFDPHSNNGHKPRASRGILAMRERAQAGGGHFELRAAPGGGTRITVRVPC